MYLTGKLRRRKKKLDPITWLFLAFDLAPQMFPKQQEYDFAVSLYYVIAISLFLLTLRFSNSEEKNPHL